MWSFDPTLRLRRSCRWACGLFLVVTLLVSARAAAPTSFAWEMLGEKAAHWQGLAVASDGWSLQLPGTATWRHPEGEKGRYKHGFRLMHDDAADWSDMAALQFDVRLEDAAAVHFTVALVPRAAAGDQRVVSAQLSLQGQGWHTVTLPWSAFDAFAVQREFLSMIKEVRLTADGKGQVTLRNVRAVRGATIGLATAVKGKSAPAGGFVEYAVDVGNVSAQAQSVALTLPRYGWEVMAATIEPQSLMLAPGAVGRAIVRVQVPENVPAGGHEKQVLQAIPNGDGAAATAVTFTTAREVAHPNILHSAARWADIRERVQRYDWARAAQSRFIDRADRFVVPEPGAVKLVPGETEGGPAVFATSTEGDVFACAISWQLTGKKSYAEKVAGYLRGLSDPARGYSKTFRACSAGFVQEGAYFQRIAMSYDMVLDAGVLSAADRAQIEKTFRLFMETVDRANQKGAINNWNVAEVTGALFCALAMQDLDAADRFFSGPSGVVDQLAKGVMDDGWWYECSISYNTWVAAEFTQVALALEPWGIRFKDAWVPANYSPHVMLTTDLSGGQSVRTGPEQPPRYPFGMSPDAAGPNRRPFRAITDMWNSLLPFLDYRGVMFGVNDSTEARVAGIRPDIGISPFELAYFVYRNPAYAALIKLSPERDLLYALPDLPDNDADASRRSAYADNVGVVTLRSQTENRPIREQIQATLHYGTHGWAHGHYDRTNLLSLMRYGRSFYNPEMVWYGYGSFLYKFYVQGSNAKNMVVVDRKQQEATPGERTLMFSGKMMQAAVVETTARWSNPPYGGMVYSAFGGKTREEKIWDEGRSMLSPNGEPPEYGTLTGYTEPVLQRRLMVVTDDYVVLADYVKGGQPHLYESLVQMKGFLGMEARAKKFLGHDALWDADPLKDAQFVTDVDRFAVSAPAVSRFQMKWGPGADNAGTRTFESEDGVLNLDVHTLWPTQAEISIGAVPEFHPIEKQLFYAVRGDGRTLAEGRVGAWILGRGEVDVSLDGVTQLELETAVKLSKLSTVFWADVRIVTKEGAEIPLRELAPQFDNVEQPKIEGRDYFGGPIKIVGVEARQALPAQPRDGQRPAIVRVNLAGRNALRLKASVGSDYPVGDEAQRRKTHIVKPAGAPATEARFLTIIEPHEGISLIDSAIASSADSLRVRLKDGREQEIVLEKFTGSGRDVRVTIREFKAGQLVRSESTP